MASIEPVIYDILTAFMEAFQVPQHESLCCDCKACPTRVHCSNSQDASSCKLVEYLKAFVLLYSRPVWAFQQRWVPRKNQCPVRPCLWSVGGEGRCLSVTPRHN